MEGTPSVEFSSQVGLDAGLGTRHRNRSQRHQDLRQVLPRSSSERYLDQEVTAAPDVLGHEDDFLDRFEDEEALDDMTPDSNNPHAHRRTSSPADCAVKKSNKPLMEKRRRQRINKCLNDLKTLVLAALNKDPAQYSKLEKADILEMTLSHLKLLHRPEAVASRMMGNSRIIGSGDDLSKYRAGFVECTNAVARYLSGMNDVPHDLHTKVLTHLNAIASSVTSNINTNATCVQNSVNVMPNPAPIILVLNNPTTASAPISQVATQPISFHESAGNSLGAQPNVTVIAAPRTQGIATPVQQQPQINGLQILPTHLNNGDLTLVLPATLPVVAQHKETRAPPSAALQASAPVLTAILTSDRNHHISSSSSLSATAATIVQPPALSTSSDDSAIGTETLDISDSDLSSGISTPVSSMSSASSPLPAEEVARMSPRRAGSSRSNSPPKPHMLNSSCFREELNSTACSSHSTPRRHQVIAPKPSHPWSPRYISADAHKRKKANTPPPPEDESQPVWRPWS